MDMFRTSKMLLYDYPYIRSSICGYAFLCRRVCLYTARRLYACIFIHVFLHMSDACLPSFCLCVCLCICVWVCLFICLFACVSVCPSVCSSVRLSVDPSFPRRMFVSCFWRREHHPFHPITPLQFRRCQRNNNRGEEKPVIPMSSADALILHSS